MLLFFLSLHIRWSTRRVQPSSKLLIEQGREMHKTVALSPAPQSPADPKVNRDRQPEDNRESRVSEIERY